MLPPLLGLRAFSGQPDFIRLMASRFLGSSANQMLLVAIGWQMYNLTGSAWDLGLVGLYQFMPVLLLTLIAGHTADRYPRTLIIATCVALQATVAAVLLAGTAGQWVTRDLLLTVSLVLGTARAFQHPAQGSLIGALLPASLLPRGAAFHAATMQTTVIGGPAAAGLLFMQTGVAVYATSMMLLVASFTLMLFMRRLPAAAPAHPLSLDALLAGVRFVGGKPILLGAVSLDLMAVLLGGATALLPMYAKEILQVGSEGLGALRAAPAVGAVICSLILSRRPLRSKVGKWMFAGVTIYGLSTLVFGLSTHFLLSLVALAISGAADMVSVVIRHTLMQLDTPDDIRGRVGSVNTIFIGASNQLGEFESGAVAAWIGPVGSVVTGALGTLVIVALWIRLFPALWRRDSFTQS
jgi:MFS family permease